MTHTGRVQRSFVDVRTIRGPIISLASHQHRHHYDYCTIIEVEGISYDLKSTEEQVHLNDLYQHLLGTLSSPIQILWRILPLNLHPYMQQFTLPDASSEKPNGNSTDMLKEIAMDHLAFVHRLASQRVLLDRKLYLILRSTPPIQTSTARWHMSSAKHRRQAEEIRFAQARQELELHVTSLLRQLQNMHLAVTRLTSREQLLSLYYSCLNGSKAEQFPLVRDLIEGVERPTITTAGWSIPNDIQASHLPNATHHRSVALTNDVLDDLVKGVEPETSTYEDHPERWGAYSDFPHMEDLIAPSSIEITRDYLRIEDEYCRGISVTHLPRVVTTGWLKPLADLDEPMDISIHLVPKATTMILPKLRHKQNDYRSTQLLAQRRNSEMDPHLKIAQGDVDPLIEQLASGEITMLDLSLNILIRASSKRALTERTERIQAILHTMLVRARVPAFEQAALYRSCLPQAHNLRPAEAILLDTHAASSLFPFISNSLVHPDGILEGVTPQGDPIFLDPWSSDLPNANRVVFGEPGQGKSHALKMLLLRMMIKYSVQQQHRQSHTLPFQQLIIDPDREFGLPCAISGGQIVYLSPGSPHHINPFDVPQGDQVRGDRLADHVQKIHVLLELMLADRTSTATGTLTSHEKGLLDRTLFETYRKVGITSDPKTHDRPAPLMRDLYDVLASGLCGPDSSDLSSRLRRYVHGSLAGLFAGPTNVLLTSTCIVFDVHALESELRPIGLFLVSNFVWTTSFQSRIPRQLIIDEAASLPQAFLIDLVCRARKHYLSVVVITQQPDIFQNSSLIANCATAVLMSEHPAFTELFHLSEKEQQLLRRLPIGEALLITAGKRLHVRYEASELEHLISTTNPKEVAALEANLGQNPLYQRVVGMYTQLLRTYEQIDDTARPHLPFHREPEAHDEHVLDAQYTSAQDDNVLITSKRRRS